MLCLAGGGSQIEAATEAGVDRTTIQRWLRNPEFVAAVDAEIEAALASARKSLRAAAPKAVSALLSIAGNEEAPESARVQAAKEILNRVGLVEATVVQHAGHDGGPLKAFGVALSDADDDTVRALASALRGEP